MQSSLDIHGYNPGKKEGARPATSDSQWKPEYKNDQVRKTQQ